MDKRNWLGNLFDIVFDLSYIISIFLSCKDYWSSQIRDIVIASIVHIFHSIWMTRNINLYNKVVAMLHALKMKILTSIATSANILKGQTVGAQKDILILQNLSLP